MTTSVTLKPFRFTVGTLLFVLVVVGVACVLVQAFYFAEVHRIIGQNQSYKELSDTSAFGGNAIPKEATDISYTLAPGRLSLTSNFRVPEKAFLDWATREQWPIQRLSPNDSPRSLSGAYTKSNGQWTINGGVTISDGFVFEDSDDHNTVVVAFDRDLSRAYFTKWHSR